MIENKGAKMTEYTITGESRAMQFNQELEKLLSKYNTHLVLSGNHYKDSHVKVVIPPIINSEGECIAEGADLQLGCIFEPTNK
jgi:hypothetical protein